MSKVNSFGYYKLELFILGRDLKSELLQVGTENFHYINIIIVFYYKSEPRLLQLGTEHILKASIYAGLKS